MADVNISTVASPVFGTLFTVGVNRYILGNVAPFQSGAQRKLAVQVFLNTGTISYAFQARVPGQATWQAIQGTPLSALGTPASSGTTSEAFQFTIDGLEFAINVTATTGSPQVALS
jgi:hypothetical protein